MDSESSSCNEREIILHDKIASPRKLPFQYLKEITNSFSAERVLGGGGFGVVYKAVLHNGELMAVKRLMAQMPGSQKQFENEVYHLMSLNHPNIVRCIGYCYETQNLCLKYDGNHIFAETAERLLCLEYMPKGSLDNHLADESCGLDWHTRYNIISGICYGLHYIHKEWQVNTPIIHLDLKPANILLGDNMLPKIADFGLSRLFGEQQTRDCTKCHDGTLGYMAPEYLHRGIITTKSDIFSLGVIIIEIITGYRNYPWPSATGTPYHDFVELVLKNWRKRSEAASLETDFQQIRSCLEMGLSCLESDPDKRPATTEIIERLNRLGSTNCHVGSNERSSTFQIASDPSEFLVINPREFQFCLASNEQSAQLTNKSAFAHFVAEEDVEAVEACRRPLVPEEPVSEEEPEEASGSGGGEVDAHADEFINKFRHQLKQQRIDSFVNYRDMLRLGQARVQLKERIARDRASDKSAFAHFVAEEDVEAVEARRPATTRDGARRRPLVPEEPVSEEEPEEASGSGGGEVDARADEFINKFHHQLKLQRIDSFARYRDTLRRGQANVQQ